MKKEIKKAMLVVTLTVAGALTFPVFAQVSTALYLRIDGIDGECMEAGHKNWIDVISYSQSASSPAYRGAQASLSDITVLKHLDKASPRLFLAALQRKTAAKAWLDFCVIGQSPMPIPFYRIELDNATITSVQTSFTEGQLPMEQISISFEQIKIAYQSMSPSGASEGWIEANWTNTME